MTPHTFIIAATITETQRAVIVAVIAAGATVIVAVLTGLIAYFSSKRQQRRVTYSEAIRAAVGWKEMLYRVRRRQQTNELKIVEDFHDLQDRLSYYEAWVGAESKFMARSYSRLVTAIKAKTESLITEAWDEDIRPLPGNAIEGDQHPSIEDDVKIFLKDVRSHLSPQPWRKVSMMLRNREK